MDNHSTSWAGVALLFSLGYGVGAASALLALGLWRALRWVSADA